MQFDIIKFIWHDQVYQTQQENMERMENTLLVSLIYFNINDVGPSWNESPPTCYEYHSNNIAFLVKIYNKIIDNSHADRQFTWHYLVSSNSQNLQQIIGSLLTLCLLMSSAVILCNQFGPRSGPKKHWVWSGTRLFDTQMAFLKEIFEKINFEKKSAGAKKSWKNSEHAKSHQVGGNQKHQYYWRL